MRDNLRKEVHDVRVIWRAEIGSDHHLVLMKVNIGGWSKTNSWKRKKLAAEEGYLLYESETSNWRRH